MLEVKKIKQCIYEGYRFELYIWNEGISSYVSVAHHNTINLDSKLTKNISIKDGDIQQNRPMFIVLGATILSQSTINIGMYDFTGLVISVLDGFVDFDVDFINA